MLRAEANMRLQELKAAAESITASSAEMIYIRHPAYAPEFASIRKTESTRFPAAPHPEICAAVFAENGSAQVQACASAHACITVQENINFPDHCRNSR